MIKSGRGGGALVEIPIDVEKEFGTRGRVPVNAKIDGVPYRGSIAPMGGVHVLGILKAVREAIGKSVGETVQVVFDVDAKPRTVQVPDDLKKALRLDPKAGAVFEKLPYTHRKEYCNWITEAKRPETRERRIRETLNKLTGR